MKERDYKREGEEREQECAKEIVRKTDSDLSQERGGGNKSGKSRERGAREQKESKGDREKERADAREREKSRKRMSARDRVKERGKDQDIVMGHKREREREGGGREIKISHRRGRNWDGSRGRQITRWGEREIDIVFHNIHWE